MKLIFISLLTVISLVAQGQYSPMIIGGQEVIAGSDIAKSTVLINGKIARASFTCTGVIFSKNLILTAGHCLGAPGWAELKVFFGVNKKKPGQSIKVIQQIRMANIPINSPPYDWQDLALLKLEKPIPEDYRPANIAMENPNLKDGDDVIMAGYGVTTANSKYSGDGGAGVLRAVLQKIITAQHGNTEILVDNSMKGACSGDSGGPLFIERESQLLVVGITSRMSSRNIVPGSKPVRYECRVDIIYTQIFAHREWIEKVAMQMMGL